MRETDVTGDSRARYLRRRAQGNRGPVVLLDATHQSWQPLDRRLKFAQLEQEFIFMKTNLQCRE